MRRATVNIPPPVEVAAKCCFGTVHLEVDGECGDFSVKYYRAKFRVAAINCA